MHATHFCANLRSMRGRFSLTALLMVLGITLSLRASDPTRDFSGKWVLDPSASDIASLGQVETNLNVSQGGGGILCSAGAVQWSYALDGSETRKQIGEESRSSVIKWEGAALLVNTQVSGPRHYTVMDRWEISRSHNTLTITRQVVRANDGEAEGTLVFRREGAPVAAPPAALDGDGPLGDLPQPQHPHHYPAGGSRQRRGSGRHISIPARGRPGGGSSCGRSGSRAGK